MYDDDTPTLVQFKAGWERDGTSDDGLPYFRGNIIIRLDRPPLLSVVRVVEADDIANHPLAFELFRKEQLARKQSYAEGFPLCMWPAVEEAEFQMLVHRDVTTVQQLAGLRGSNSLPAELRDLAERASKMLEMMDSTFKYGDLLREREGRIEALEEQVQDAIATIAAQKTMIDQLRLRGVG